MTAQRAVARRVTDRPAAVRDLAWEPTRARAFGAAVLDLWTELLERLRELPVSRELAPADVASALALEVPEEPMEPDALLAHLRELVFEQSAYVGHPAFLAYIVGAGTVPAAAAELLAAGLNPNVGGYRLSPGASQIELHLTRWLAGRFGLPEGAGGLVMTGGAMANFVALKCARDDRLGDDVREAGVAAAGPVALYESTEAHVVIQRAADMLGLGAGAVRALPVDAEQRLSPVALELAIAADRAAGVRPLAVCATAGSTTTGSIDPLPALAALAAEHDCWFHVDAAYGGGAILSEQLAPLLAGIERADSLVVDPHKWLYTPQSAGVVLLRDFEALGAPRDRLRHARPRVLTRLRRAEGVDLAAGSRPRRLRPADRARRGARGLPRRAGQGAPRLRADGPAAPIRLLLPLPPGRLEQRRGDARPT